jgi:hypothetical protein
MSSKRGNSPGKRKPPKSDDFKLIKGITPSIEGRLREAQIFTFSQLAAITPANLAELIGGFGGVSEERIIEQNWLGQARELAPISSKKQDEEAVPVSDIENEGFVVDLFLDGEKQVRKTQVLQVKSGEGDEWEGWDETRLINFFIRRTEMRLSEKRHEAEAAVATAKTVISDEPASSPAERSGSQAGVVNLRSVETIPANNEKASRLIKSGEPFRVRLSFGIDDPLKSNIDSFDYALFISASKFGENSRQTLRQAQGMINVADDAIMVDVPRPDLQPGLYKIEATLEINPTSTISPISHSAITTAAVQVY